MENFNFFFFFFFAYGKERTNGVKFIPPCSLRKFASLTCFARRGIKSWIIKITKFFGQISSKIVWSLLPYYFCIYFSVVLNIHINTIKWTFDWKLVMLRRFKTNYFINTLLTLMNILLMLMNILVILLKILIILMNILLILMNILFSSKKWVWKITKINHRKYEFLSELN